MKLQSELFLIAKRSAGIIVKAVQLGQMISGCA